jgi:hypothetical protein
LFFHRIPFPGADLVSIEFGRRLSMSAAGPNSDLQRCLLQSGLRASTPTVPNGAALPEYAVVNASIVQKLDLGIGQGTVGLFFHRIPFPGADLVSIEFGRRLSMSAAGPN